MIDGAIIELRVAYDVEMSDYSVRYKCSASARGAHRGEYDDVFEFHKGKVTTVVPTFVIEVLSEKFDRGLCTVDFFFRHIEVVDENYAFFTDRGTENSFTTFIELTIDGVLCLIRGGLRRKGQANILETFVQGLGQEGEYILRFTGTCWSRSDHVTGITHKQFQEEKISRGIGGRNGHFVVA